MNSKLIIAIGRLTKDPVMDCNKRAKLELVNTNGECIQFTRCVAIGKPAELVMRDLKKGDFICINGEWREQILEAFYIFKELI